MKLSQKKFIYTIHNGEKYQINQYYLVLRKQKKKSLCFKESNTVI